MASNVSLLAEANRQHWDKIASTDGYDSKPWQKAMISAITSHMRARRAVFGIPVDSHHSQAFRLLDYACGTGVVSRALGPYVSQTVGVDISAGMVETYNARARDAGLAVDTIHAVQGNLFAAEVAPALDGDAFRGFDAAVVGMGFHHFEDYARCLRSLAERCRVGGTVGIVDLYPNEEDLKKLHEHYKAMMHKNGFTEEEMRGYMQEAGLVDVQFVKMEEPVTMVIEGRETHREIFFASGRKA